MKLIIGLGNPGRKYHSTRHNVGWLVLDELAGRKKWQNSPKAEALYVVVDISDQPAELVKPQTFMNNSGRAVATLMRKHDVSPADVIVIHDEKDLPFGKLRVSTGSSSAGHRGVQSIIDTIGSQQFTRLRVGVGNELLADLETDQFVLKSFTAEEKKQLPDILTAAIEKLNEIV